MWHRKKKTMSIPFDERGEIGSDDPTEGPPSAADSVGPGPGGPENPARQILNDLTNAMGSELPLSLARCLEERDATSGMWVQTSPGEIKRLLDQLSLDRDQFAAAVHIPRETIDSWLDGGHVAPARLQARIVKFLGDFVAAESELKNRVPQWTHVSKEEILAFQRLIGLSNSQLALLLGVHKSAPTTWFRYGKVPRPQAQLQFRKILDNYYEQNLVSGVAEALLRAKEAARKVADDLLRKGVGSPHHGPSTTDGEPDGDLGDAAAAGR